MIVVIGSPLTSERPGSPQEIAHEDEVLDRQRLVEPQLLVQVLSMNTACVGDAMAVTFARRDRNP